MRCSHSTRCWSWACGYDARCMWMKRYWLRLIDILVDRVVGPTMNQMRADRGLKPVSRIFDEWCIYSPDATLGLFPDWFGPPQADWKHPVTLTGFPLYDESDQRQIDDLQTWFPQATHRSSSRQVQQTFTPGPSWQPRGLHAHNSTFVQYSSAATDLTFPMLSRQQSDMRSMCHSVICFPNHRPWYHTGGSAPAHKHSPQVSPTSSHASTSTSETTGHG